MQTPLNGSSRSGLTSSGTYFRIEAADWRDPGRFLVTGEIDLGSAPQVMRTLMPVVEAGGSGVLDLAALTYCDSQGIRVLMTLAESAGVHGGSVALANPQRHVRHVFQIVRLADVMDVLDDASSRR
jgi:anti-sigma B factor antagonist